MKVNNIEMFSVKEIAKMFKIHPDSVRIYFRTNKLKGVKIGTKWYCSRKNLNRFLNAEKI
ncbi:MAG: helix-turn-helix domain-containing protein [Bacteroidetes bacterium]|nr:helix-turn-helix domain-containing protein [Bacteroidota bacterium]MBC8488377.1 helix-turn-helix domain-containing protein [Bacteroidota bacterium]